MSFPESAYMALLLCAAAPFLGSFACLVGLRLPRGRAWIGGRSSCPSCGRALAALDMLPIAGWLHRRGRCRYCAARISAVYPFTEALAVAAAVYSVTVLSWPVALPTVLLAALLIAIGVADWRHGVIPDLLTVTLLLGGLATAALTVPANLPAHAAAVAVGFAALYGIAKVYGWVRGCLGLGLGDVKLFAAAGAWVSLAGLPSVLLWAGVTGLAGVAAMRLAGRRVAATTALPFGPSLAVGIWIVWTLGPLAPPG